jgi:hypothetical protein
MAVRGRFRADAALALALAGGSTVAEAAAAAGVSERTCYRRLENAEFRRQIAAARAAMFDSALGRLAGGMGDAAGALRKLLRAKSDSAKLGAARSILELGSKLREQVELAERLAEVEWRLRAGRQAGEGGAG